MPEACTLTEGTVSPNTDRSRPVNNIFIFTLQPICVEVGRVLVDEALDRLKTKTKHYNIIYIMALIALF